MKVSFTWLRELVDLNITNEELVRLLPLRTIGTKEVTKDFVELDMKGYNRADLLSMRGVAQEVAAITGGSAIFQDISISNVIASGAKQSPHTPVTVEDESLCPLYCVAKIEGLQAKNSPSGWVKKLEDSSMRSINNVTDITNLIMLEYGQPLHAFDATGIKDEKIIVRLAKTEEKLTTLDGKKRELEPTDLLITDPEKVLGLAGVMGGKDSEVSDSTTTVLLEAAIFNPISIRKTAQYHHLPSEAAKRFQHGLTKTRLLQALDAAIKMYEDLGGKLTALTIVGDTSDHPKGVKLNLEKVDSLIGVSLTEQQVQQSLEKLGFRLHPRGVIWEVEIPYWRLDIEIEEDLIEEVARLYGYEKIPAKPLQGELPAKIDQSLFNLLNNLRAKLVEIGLTEVQTYSFYSTKVLKSTGKDRYLDYYLKIANPMSKETEYLRSDLWPNLVEVVDRNLRQGFTDIAVFEIGKVYNLIKGSLPEEEYRLAIAIMDDSNNPIAEVYKIAQQLNLTAGDSTTDQYAKDYFHPTRFTTLTKGDKTVGGIAEIHPRILDKFGISQRVAVLEVSIKELL